MKQSIQYGIVRLLGIALMSPLFGWSQGLVTGTVSDENGMHVHDASFVKLRELRLGYQFTSKLMEKLLLTDA